jgi:PAS domain S-box-containing protein
VHDEIPHEFFRHAWQNAEHPLACVGVDNRFVLVNEAFEQLVGYSNAELREMTWMDITVQADVGGDLASVNEVLTGRSTHYRLSKRYVHKRGHTVPVELIVRRFPQMLTTDIAYFSVEAPKMKPTREELDDFQDRVNKVIKQMGDQIDENDHRDHSGYSVNIGDNWRDGNKAGRDMDSASSLRVMAGVLGVIAVAVIWMVYYLTTMNNGTPPSHPPSIPGTTHSTPNN